MIMGAWGLGKKKQESGYWGLCFTAEQAGSTVAMTPFLNPSWTPTIMTSTDGGETWENFVVNSTVINLANIGDKIWFKAGQGGNAKIGGNARLAGWRFSMSGLLSASGDLMSLIDGETPLTEILTANAFGRVFEGCTSLTSAPELLATTLATNCYGRLFYGCSNLNHIKVNASSWINGTYQKFALWVSDVASTGMFHCPVALGTNETIERGEDYCPEGWTVINDVEA